MKKTLIVGVGALALSLGAASYASQPLFSPRSETYEQLELFSNVLALVQQNYVVKVDTKKLINAALEGMLSSLDPHSSFLSDDDYADLQQTTEGAYGGLGIEVTGADGAVKIVTPMDDTPAMRANLQSGDYITAIDGNSIIGMKLNDAIAKMKGDPGTKIKLTIYRPGQADTFDVELTREIITVKSVKIRMEGDYGYLRISRFSKNTDTEAKTALLDLLEQHKKAGRPIKGLVLDLRNNPGGLLEQSVCVADLFLSNGEIVSQRERDPQKITRYQAESANCGAKGDLTGGVPIVVLINPGSASAAEIVAGALQDRKRATTVGLTSFGKGSVQTVVPLDRTHAVKLTTARYYTPSGRSIQKTGIEPDLEVAQSLEQAKYIATSASQYTEAAYGNALDADEGKVRRSEHAQQELPPEGFDTKEGDFQLTRALDVLKYNGDVDKAKTNRKGKIFVDAELLDKPANKFGADGKPINSATSASSSASSTGEKPAKPKK